MASTPSIRSTPKTTAAQRFVHQMLSRKNNPEFPKMIWFNIFSRFRTRYVANSTPTFSPKKKLDFEFHDSSDAGK